MLSAPHLLVFCSFGRLGCLVAFTIGGPPLGSLRASSALGVALLRSARSLLSRIESSPASFDPSMRSPFSLRVSRRRGVHRQPCLRSRAATWRLHPLCSQAPGAHVAGCRSLRSRLFMAFSVARLGAGSSSLRSLPTLPSVFRSHAWRLPPLRLCLMSGSSTGLGLFRPGVFAPVFMLAAPSSRHAWRTGTSSCAATWRFGDCITASSALLHGVAPTPFSSRLPIDVAPGFVLHRSFRSAVFSPRSSPAHLGVAYVALLWCRHVALERLSHHTSFLAVAVVSRAFSLSRIAASRLSARVFRFRSKRLLLVGSGPVPSHHHGQEARR